MNMQEVVEAFELLETWDERYELITELGGDLLPLEEHQRVDANLVQGCTTRTWLAGRLTSDDPPVMEYRAEAEGPLVRGLVALLLIPFQGRTPDAVLATDPDGYIGRLGLEAALSAQRRAGMQAFLDRVRQIARYSLEPGGGG